MTAMAKKSIQINEKVSRNREIVLNFINEKNKSIKIKAQEVPKPMMSSSTKEKPAATQNKQRKPKTIQKKSDQSLEKSAKSIIIHSDFLLNYFKHLLVVPILLISIYFIFSIYLFSFSPDNQVARKINQFIPVPAIITSEGMVDYYSYQDAKASLFNRSEINPTLDYRDISTLAKEQSLKKLFGNQIIKDRWVISLVN
ncbi:MAG: hypothetical protein UT48_C0018G0015 [Parcubacteria group bacterium GW2011_GWE2_39_37]|uniref:Uncharacterized protein n=1 Tax=Candidatus Falkowbacteria bacterium GW2011_GWF2_39_8 TaxID=1618642 RepID=A0A0G0PS04_9BACT|nr:MAG: hypothetical protein UT48_C0018G0015 [Parcubacteria group bacterium GW2011_GWE2_39_37]KKR30944.1 MAG: hypothetical protein UT64_C0079G0005 [Candidatus Falkowbacteria bacterium GW2011_GWF2_39_8]